MMQEKINIAELLKDCPNGMELDCTMYDNLYFDSLNADYYGTINCYTLIAGTKTSISFTKYGTFNDHMGAKCVIFPKGKTTWEGFHRPFRDGDIVSTTNGMWLGIVKKPVGSAHETYIAIENNIVYTNVYTNNIFGFERFATEEEKAKLFQTIKDNGYKWNTETKTLEKLTEPKFKVGDRVIRKATHETHIINHITSSGYVFKNEGGTGFIFGDAHLYELAPNKFDITTFKPFDKVLARCSSLEKWRIQLFEKYDKTCKYPFICMGYNKYKECIPYEGNEYLLDTADNCDEYYKTWKQ